MSKQIPAPKDLPSVGSAGKAHRCNVCHAVPTLNALNEVFYCPEHWKDTGEPLLIKMQEEVAAARAAKAPPPKPTKSKQKQEK